MGIDLIMIMLGTNDARTDFNATPEQITENLQKMIRFIKSSHLGTDFTVPQILIIAPPPILKITPEFSLFFDETSIEKTKQLAKHYRKLAEEEQCYFLDAGPIVKISPIDGVHIEKESQADLAEAIAQEIKKIYDIFSVARE